MKTLTAGHRYELASVEGGEPQVIQFIDKRPSGKKNEDGVLVTFKDGTTNEEVLAVLIDRLAFLQAALPSDEGFLAHKRVKDALMWLNKRTADRKARKVEGTSTK